MSEELSDFFKIVSEDKKKKKEEFNEMVGDLGLDSLFNDIAAEKKRIKEEKEKQLAKKVEEEKKQKEKFDKIVGDMSLDSLFGDLAKVKKESKEEKEKEQKILSSFENFLTNKIDDIEEIKDEVVEDVNVVEEVKPEPEEVKPEPEVPSFVEKSLEILDEVSDPLTPLDQNFATLQDLQDHYRKFLVRIQQQLSSLGGGGIEDAPKTGGPYVRQGQKWVVSSGGGGIGTDGSVNTTGIITASSFSGDGSALTGISGGIGTDGSVNTTGIITASSFSGDGSALTGISTFSGNYNDLTNTPTIPTNNNQLTNGAGYITTSFTSTSQLTNDAGFITNNISSGINVSGFSTFQGDVRITDDDKLRFGTSSGGILQIYTNGTNSFFKQSSGDLKYELADQFIVQKDSGDEPIAKFNSDADVELYYDGNKKFETTSYGVGIAGSITVDNDLNVTGVSTFSGITSFRDDIHVHRTDGSIRYINFYDQNGGNQGSIQQAADGGSGALRVYGKNLLRLASDADVEIVDGQYNTKRAVFGDAGVELYSGVSTSSTKKFETTASGIDVTGHTETDTLNVSGLSTFTGSISLPDSSGDLVGRATFGDSDDLRIYHDGNNSIIQEVGAGDLRLAGNVVKLNNGNNTATMVKASDGGSVELNHNGSKKFETTASGIDVTGHTETDTLRVSGVSTFQSNAIFEGNVGIGSTQPTEELDVVGKVNISDDLFISGPDDRAFFVDAGLGRLGVGTKNPTRVLDLVGHGPFTADFQLTQHNSDADAGAFRLRRSRGTADSPTALTTNDGVGALAFYRYDGTDFRKNGAVEADVKNGDSNSGIRLIFQTSEGTTSAENRLVIMPTGEIGIGKDDPDSLLTIQGTSNLQDLLEFRTSANRRLFIKTPATTHTRDAFQIQTENSLEFVVDTDLAMRIDHDANVGIGTTAPTEKFEVNGKAVITDDLFVSGPDDRAFFVDAGSGRLGVGTKTPQRVLDLVGHGPATADFQLTQLNDTADGGAFRLRRARGSAGSETALIDNDGVGSLAYYRYDGTDYRKNGAIEAKVENGDSSLGIKLLFQTNEGTSSGVDRMVILPNGNVGIGKASPSVALDVNGTIEADVLVADGGTYDTGTESKSDAALVMTEDSAIYTLDNSGTRLRRLIEKQTDFIKIGQVDTSLVDGIRLYPGNAGSVRLFHGTTSESTGEKLETIGTGVTVYGTTYTNQLNVSGLSTFQSHVHLEDNDELRIGSGNDLKLWHNGFNSIINDEGVGDLYLGGNASVNITNGALSEFKAKFITDGAVELYHDNNKKFETIGTGVTVYGDAYVGSDNSAGVVLRSPDGTAYRLIVANDGTLTTTAV